MDCLIGFLITRENIAPNINIFKTNIKMICINYGNYNIYLWGIGDIEKCKINNKYSFSFPIHDCLLDRNILLYFEDNKIIIENDWLGSIPVFYNKKAKKVSTISNLVSDDKTLDFEGLYNYLRFGYSVLEQTAFRNVQFLRYYSKLVIEDDLFVLYKEDVILKENWYRYNTKPFEVIERIKEYVINVEKAVNGLIIIPTSGGYDSRLLNYLLEDKTRIRSFTYGISKNQIDSYEVVYARKLSERLGTYWKQIEIGKFNEYIEEWYKIYGFSTHLHGMYHIEFYKKIKENYVDLSNAVLLSGIFGDVWAGSVPPSRIANPEDVYKLGYTHGVSLDKKDIELKINSSLISSFFEDVGEYLRIQQLQTVFTIRFKIILISYLISIPNYFGWPVFTPFLNYEIVLSILRLKPELRKNRIWQRSFFQEKDLDFESMHIRCSRSNWLDICAAKIFKKFKPLDTSLFYGIIRSARIEEINRRLSNFSFRYELEQVLLSAPKLGGLLGRLNILKRNTYLKALYDYYVLKSIEMALEDD